MGSEAGSDGRGRAPEVDSELDVAMARFQACIEQRDQALAAVPRARWLEVLPAYLVHS